MARVWESVGQKRKSAGAIWCFMRLREDINGVDPVGWHFSPSYSILQTIWGGLRAKQVEEKEGEVKMERLNLLIHTHIYIDIYTFSSRFSPSMFVRHNAQTQRRRRRRRRREMYTIHYGDCGAVVRARSLSQQQQRKERGWIAYRREEVMSLEREKYLAILLVDEFSIDSLWRPKVFKGHTNTHRHKLLNNKRRGEELGGKK